MRTSDQTAEITKALLAFAKKVKSPRRTEVYGDGADFWTNAPLDVVLDTIKRPLQGCELVVVQDTTGDGRVAGAMTRIMHTSGEWIETDWLLFAAGSSAWDGGGVVTYARRMSLLGALNLVAVDDEATRASLEARKAEGCTRQPVAERAGQSAEASSAPISVPQRRLIDRLASERDGGPELIAGVDLDALEIPGSGGYRTASGIIDALKALPLKR